MPHPPCPAPFLHSTGHRIMADLIMHEREEDEYSDSSNSEDEPGEQGWEKWKWPVLAPVPPPAFLYPYLASPSRRMVHCFSLFGCMDSVVESACRGQLLARTEAFKMGQTKKFPAKVSLETFQPQRSLSVTKVWSLSVTKHLCN